MAGSADVKPTDQPPNVMWASLAHSGNGLSHRFALALTHNGQEGVLDAVIKDVTEALTAVIAKHGFTL